MGTLAAIGSTKLKSMTLKISLLFLLLISCNHKDSNIEKENISIKKNKTLNNNFKSEKNQLSESISKKIIGVWSNGSSENAEFEIKEKTIYYVDQFEDYKYSLIGNHITINYPDYVYDGMIEFKNDTLIMISKKFGTAKYWKFKE